jgi:hypothetical protein
MFKVPTILTQAVSENTQERYSLGVKTRNDHVIEHVSRNTRVLPVVQFAKCHFGIGIDESLLINMADTFNIPDIIRTLVRGILRSKIPRMFRFYLPMRFFFLFPPFQSG